MGYNSQNKFFRNVASISTYENKIVGTNDTNFKTIMDFSTKCPKHFDPVVVTCVWWLICLEVCDILTSIFFIQIILTFILWMTQVSELFEFTISDSITNFSKFSLSCNVTTTPA